MKLSDFKNSKLSKEDIDKIVFSNIDYREGICDYALVFGHKMLIKERTSKAVEVYKKGRVSKLVFLGGGHGDSNSSNDHTPESWQMRDLAIKMGVKSNDIIVEDKSSNTKENIMFSIKLLDIKKNDTVMLITSEFHLKRCDAIIKKIIPGINTILVKVNDGIHDRNNWYKNDNIWNNHGKHGSGKSLVINEAKILIQGACDGILEDIELNEKEEGI